jgi:hypothetical protein
MRARRLLVVMMLMTAGGRAAAGTAQATMIVRATVVRSITVKAVAVEPAARGLAARGPGVETTVRGGDRDVRWVETRSHRTSADGTKEMLVTVWADGAPPAVVFRTGS